MVEFALVLPVLLLLILGIIAFGHLFFVYSFTVAASREAARWGSAVGLTSSGLPRFRDCDAILDTAVRVGGMAGVRPENTVIEYDHGPDSGAAYDDCPVGGEGPDVTLSDRILVTVNVNYKPIVPLVSIPDIPLSATTARTIIRGLPVGEAPTIPPTCISTFFDITNTTPPLDVGQPEEFSYVVKTAGGDQPTTGRVYINIGSTKVVDGSTSLSGTFTHTFNASGEVQISAKFVSTDYKFCSIDPASNFTFKVRRVTGITVIRDQPDPSIQGERVEISVLVGEKTPSGSIQPLPAGSAPTGVVYVYDQGYPEDGCLITLDSNGMGSCQIDGFFLTGIRSLVISYPDGDTEFGPSQKIEPHTVDAPPTFIPTPTPKPTFTPAPTATPKPKPICPEKVREFVFNEQADAFWVSVNNPDPKNAVTLYSANLTWPSKTGIDALLKEVRFGASNTTACSADDPACIWFAYASLPPTNQLIGGSSAHQWRTGTDLTLPAGETKEMRFVFTKELENTQKFGTKYSLTLIFDLPNFEEHCTVVFADTDRKE